MLIVLRLLGREVLRLQVHNDQGEDEQEPEHGPPFGFSGSGGLTAELAGEYVPFEGDR
jgi:hypothetical protein